jgi:adenosylhomocysteine nucleosidase
MRIGIMSAMLEENLHLLKKLQVISQTTVAKRTYTLGRYLDKEIVIAFSRWGKIASAVTSSHLINTYQVDKLIFTGVGASTDPSVKIGDIVVGSSLVQHDMDARPLFQQFEIPLIQKTYFEPQVELLEKTHKACKAFLKEPMAHLDKQHFENFNIHSPKAHTGLIASGDKFFASKTELIHLKKQLPEVLCVEMEGASVAQVCHEHDIPFSIIRTISDGGDESSSIDFQKFVDQIASSYSMGIIDHLLKLI